MKQTDPVSHFKMSSNSFLWHYLKFTLRSIKLCGRDGVLESGSFLWLDLRVRLIDSTRTSTRLFSDTRTWELMTRTWAQWTHAQRQHRTTSACCMWSYQDELLLINSRPLNVTQESKINSTKCLVMKKASMKLKSQSTCKFGSHRF